MKTLSGKSFDKPLVLNTLSIRVPRGGYTTSPHPSNPSGALLLNRRNLLKLGPLALAAAASRNSSAQMVMLPGAPSEQPTQPPQPAGSADIRSEERCVGKECR